MRRHWAADLHATRGNHEDWHNNVVDGPYGDLSFHAEIERKYDAKEAARLKTAFRHLFYALPLATVVGSKVLVVHGGLCRAGHEPGFQRISDPVSVAEMKRVARKRDLPAGTGSRHDMILNDTLW